MSVYDTMVAGLSGAGLVLLGFVTTHGTSEYHLNAAQMQTQLQAAAQAALNKADLNWATVTMDGQRALLTGAAPGDEAATQAEQVVLAASGKGGMVWGGVISVESAFDDAPAIPLVTPYVWRAVKGDDGSFALLGAVPDETVRVALNAYAGGLSGAVDDRMEFGAGVPEGDWQSVASYGMEQLALLNSGEARMTDTELRLSGVAMDDAARIQATAAIVDLRSPWSGVANISGPSLWKAEHIGEVLVLSGSCETPEEKAEIAAIAAQYFSGEVRDEMTVVSSEYADWVDGVRLGLPHFSQFKSGEMAFEPTGEGFTFEGEATTSTLQFLREDMAKLEGDYTVAIEAEPVTITLTELAGIDLGSDPLIACQMSFDLVMQANAVVFNTGSAEISRLSGKTLDKIIAVSDTCAPNMRYEVGGHTDNTGLRENNLVLSKARAQAVANYMVATGFDSERLIVAGYGPDRPGADNATLEGRAANRRIEFKVQEWSE